MSYNVLYTPSFRKQLKKLAKKYRSLKSDLAALIAELEEHPFTGISLGKNCYKIRLAIASKGKGKSGGARVITHVYVLDEAVYLLSIYDKSDIESITDDELSDLLDQIDDENE